MMKYCSKKDSEKSSFMSLLVRSPGQTVQFDEMMRIMKSCDAVDDDYNSVDEKRINDAQLTLFGHPINLSTKTSALFDFSGAAQNIARQIFPRNNFLLTLYFVSFYLLFVCFITRKKVKNILIRN